MKRIAVTALIACTPSLAFADDTTVGEDERKGSINASAPATSEEPFPREGPRLLLDNIVGVRSSGALGAIVAAGPFSFRIDDTDSAKRRMFGVNLEGDVRVWKQLTVGGAFTYRSDWIANDYPRRVEHTIYAVRIAPRVGVLLPIAKQLHVWGRVGPHVEIVDGPFGRGSLGGSADVSLVAQVHAHVFLAAGPSALFAYRGEGEHSLDVGVSGRLGLSF